MRLWESEFFNRGVGPVLTMGGPLPGALPETVVNIESTGRVVDRSGNPVTAEYALVDALAPVVGPVLAADSAHRMALIRVVPPVRVSQVTLGVYGDGWSSGSVTYTRFNCSGGDVRVEVASSTRLRVGPVDVVPVINETPLSPVSVAPDGVPVPIDAKLVPKDGVCQVRFDIAGTVVPQEVAGVPDTRALGVLVSDVVFTPPN